MENDFLRYFAHIAIQPNATLPEMAKVLSEILSIPFIEDEDRHYEEFPAFVAEMQSVRFALLGVPDPEEDLRDDPTDDFELMVEPIRFLSQAQKVDVSEALASIISHDGRLACQILK